VENLNVYRLAVGHIEHFVAARDEQDAYKQGADPARFPDMHFLPFTITKIEVPGYDITVTPKDHKQVVEYHPTIQSGRGRRTTR